MPIKTLGSLGKTRVGRVTGNTYIFFWPKQEIKQRTDKNLLVETDLFGPPSCFFEIFHCIVTFYSVCYKFAVFCQTALLSSLHVSGILLGFA